MNAKPVGAIMRIAEKCSRVEKTGASSMCIFCLRLMRLDDLDISEITRHHDENCPIRVVYEAIMEVEK